jgi:hypothetical protein
MGAFINIGNAGFESARNSEYVDKSGLISVVNSTLKTERRFSCVTRSRRFGKSMAAQMLCAYYDHSCNSRQLFADLQIANDPSFEKHLNKYPVIYLDITAFISRYRDESIIEKIDAALRREIHETYPQVPHRPGDDLMDLLIRVVAATGEAFIFIIDEWDAICREFSKGSQAMDSYIDWLRRMFKDVAGKNVFAAVYMTGILPIKKYDTQSALNNFIEYSMVEPRRMAHYFGFTKDEVKALTDKHGMDFDEMEKWYDGYRIGDELSMFNPNSVMQAIDTGRCRSFWASTGAYDTIASYIKMNFEGLRSDIISMLGGGRCKVNPTRFSNDMHDIQSRDDVLTVLIHLGYLSYDWERNECWIPNREVAGEMENAVVRNDWTEVIRSIEQSEQLLNAVLRKDAEAVAKGVAAVHSDSTSILSYNDENSLACVLTLAFYYARNNYVVHREMATGLGYADLVLIPRRNVVSPAIIIELKKDQSAQTAIDQIRNRQYQDKVAQYDGPVILVGINYDSKTKQHECIIA